MDDARGRLLNGEGIVCLSSIDWDFLWQAHQELMTRFAVGGNPVLFIENTGVRTPNLSDLPRLIKRIKNWFGGTRGFQERATNIIVLSPILLPFPYSRLCRWVNSRLLGRSISRWIGATKRSSPILWTFLPTPIVHDLIERLDPGLVVYYCADNLTASSSAAEAVAESERRLFARADLVFATSSEIQRRASLDRPASHLFPFGVDYGKFAQHESKKVSEPPDLAAIPRPRIGYIGGVHRWMDFELLREVAVSRSELQFVFVGPEQTEPGTLKALPNVHFLGQKAHDLIPAYVAAFDAAIIPYRLTEYTASVYPTKLNEYFAMGLPVVSTPLPEVLAYNEKFGELVNVAGSAANFASQIDAALKSPPEDRPARQAAARANGWDARVTQMSGLILESLERKRLEPRVMSGVMRRLSDHWTIPAISAFVTTVLAVALVRWTPIAWFVADPLRLSYPPSAADAAVVFGGGAGELGEIGQGHQERIERAIKLRSDGFAPTVVLCAGKVQTYSEAEVMRAIALAKGVPDQDILIEPNASGTRQMVAAAARLAQERGWKRVLLVGSPYHMRRVLLVWRKQAPDIDAAPTPVLQSRFYGYDAKRPSGRRPAGASLRQVRGLLQEALTLGYYRLRGWL